MSPPRRQFGNWFWLFLLPSWVWATAWMPTSIAMLGATLWMTRGRNVSRR